jgi:hypothetical protein
MNVLPQKKVILNLPLTGTVKVIRMNTNNSFKNWFDIKEKLDDTFFLLENEDMTLKVDIDAIKEFVSIQPIIYFNQFIWDKVF